MTRHHNSNQGSEQLFTNVRAAFVGAGSSLNAHCKKNGISRSYAARCLKGEQNGTKAKALRKRLTNAAGLPDVQ